MKEKASKFADFQGVYSSLSTRHLVFQEMSTDPQKELHGRDVHIMHSVAQAGLSKASSEQARSPFFRYSKEYYEQIADEKKRMKAYKSLELSSYIADGKDAEIEKDPWKYLYLDSKADASDVRASSITLSRMWHPDWMDARNIEKLETVFKYSPFDFPVKGETYIDWLDELRAFENSTNEDQVRFASYLDGVSQETLEGMDPTEREACIAFLTKHQELEDKAELIRRTMVKVATEKMTVINKAVAAAKKKLGGVASQSLGGYAWTDVIQRPWTSSLNEDYINDWATQNLTRVYSDLKLEGDGVLRKQAVRQNRDSIIERYWALPKLSFDFGDVYMMEQGYRQDVDIRSLFAWMELKLGQEIAPSLLDGISEIYKLNIHSQERLRLMIMNRETPDFILETLEISEDEDWPLRSYLADVYTGLSYSHYNGPQRELEEYQLGVSMANDGGMMFTYVHQGDQTFGWGSYEETARFSPSDVDLMRSVAYGPMLKG